MVCDQAVTPEIRLLLFCACRVLVQHKLAAQSLQAFVQHKTCRVFVQRAHGRAFQVWHVGGVGCCTRGCVHRVRPCPGGLGYPFKAHRGFAQVSQVLSHSPVFLHDNPSAVRPRTYNHDSPCFLQFYSKNRPGKLTRHCASCLVHGFWVMLAQAGVMVCDVFPVFQVLQVLRVLVVLRVL